MGLLLELPHGGRTPRGRAGGQGGCSSTSILGSLQGPHPRMGSDCPQAGRPQQTLVISEPGHHIGKMGQHRGLSVEPQMQSSPDSPAEAGMARGRRPGLGQAVVLSLQVSGPPWWSQECLKVATRQDQTPAPSCPQASTNVCSFPFLLVPSPAFSFLGNPPWLTEEVGASSPGSITAWSAPGGRSP